jgi:hypothetical protein
MTKVLFFLAAVATLAGASLATRLDTVTGSLLLVALGVAMAWAASESVSAFGATTGALGAFGGTVLASGSAAVGAAIFVALAYAERTTRVAKAPAKLIHVATALIAGGLAGSVASSYASASLAVHGVAVVVSAVLIALPLLIEADDPTAHTLDALAREISGSSSNELHRGAELRRTADDAVLGDGAALVRRTWRSLVRMGEARARLERNRTRASGTAAVAVVEMLDQKIAAHVSTLTRAYTAVDTAHAAAVGLDDAALKGADTDAESLDEVSQAMVDV